MSNWLVGETSLGNYFAAPVDKCSCLIRKGYLEVFIHAPSASAFHLKSWQVVDEEIAMGILEVKHEESKKDFEGNK